MTDEQQTESTEPPGRGKIIESFAPTGGRVLGIIVLVIALLAIADILIEWRTWDGLTAAGVVVALGTLVWATMVRPAAALYDNALVLRNFISDFQIPWHLVDDVSVRPILTIATKDESTYRSVAVAATAAERRAQYRTRLKGGGATGGGLSAGPAMGGGGGGGAASDTDGGPKVTASEHTMSRIRTVSEKNAERSKGLTAVERRWAWPEIGVFLGAVAVAAITAPF